MTLSGNYSGLLDLFFVVVFFFFFFFFFSFFVVVAAAVVVVVVVVDHNVDDGDDDDEEEARMLLLSCNMCLSEIYQTTKYSKTVDLDPSHGKSGLLDICKQRRHSSSLTSTLSNQILWCLPL